MTSLDSSLIDEAVQCVRAHWDGTPRCGLILGTGLGDLAAEIDAEAVVPYDQIAHFPRSTALSHTGQLVCGRLGTATVVAMQGRCHRYEGYSLEQIALPVHMLRALGCELLIISNASGGVNPHFRRGDIMVLEDHINLMWSSPCGGSRESDPRPSRMPAPPYDESLIERALQIARRADFTAHRGVYLALTGPTYETRAEYRMARRVGADTVGMSTVPESLAAAELGMRVLALSVITNVANPDALQTVSGQEVVDAAQTAQANMRKIVLGILAP